MNANLTTPDLLEHALHSELMNRLNELQNGDQHREDETYDKHKGSNQDQNQ